MNPSVIITGASGNLGSVIAQKLQQEGYQVMGTVRSQSSADSLAEAGIKATALNLTDERAVAQFVESYAEGLEAAVLSVGGFDMGSFAETDKALLDKMYHMNFETAFFMVKSLLPVFEQKGGGQIILVGSKPALEPQSGMHTLAYSLSKGLVLHLAELVNAYGKEKNIRATVLVPSIIDTPINREAMPDADFSTWVSPQALADTVAFLLSPSGKQVSESVIKLYNKA